MCVFECVECVECLECVWIAKEMCKRLRKISLSCVFFFFLCRRRRRCCCMLYVVLFFCRCNLFSFFLFSPSFLVCVDGGVCGWCLVAPHTHIPLLVFGNQGAKSSGFCERIWHIIPSPPPPPPPIPSPTLHPTQHHHPPSLIYILPSIS